MNKYVRPILPLVIAIAIASASTATVRLLSSTSLGNKNATQMIEATPSVYRGTADVGDVILVKFSINNKLHAPLTLLGANSQCTCTIAEGLPATIGPQQSRELIIRVAVKKFDADGMFRNSLTLLTNQESEAPPLVVELQQRVTPKGG